jgi:hypothetical protein
MAISINNNPSLQSINLNEVVAHEAHQITMTMVRALMSGLQEKLNFAQLADKHIDVKLEENVNGSDQKTQEIFQKLLTATMIHIHEFSPPMIQTFTMINTQTPNSAGQFVGSFVWPVTQNIRASLP